jgi:flagellar hook assembly protein FlgD
MPGVNIAGRFLPETIQLIGNFPNPFNPYTTIKYDLTDDAEVSLVVYNLLGEVVQVLVSSDKPSGRHGIVWNGESISNSAVPSGIYIYQLTVDGMVSGSKKMVLVK